MWQQVVKGLGCILIIPLLCSGLIIINMGYNEIRNFFYAEQLYNYPLPTQTEVVKRETICYCPVNGGTCDLSFYQAMVTSLDRQQVEAYYAKVHFPPLREKPTLPGYTDPHPFVDVYLRFNKFMEADGRMQFVASIGEPFYVGGLDLRYSEFDPRCER